MLTVDRAMNDWRDLPSVEEICDNVIQIISDCAPGTDIYTGQGVPSLSLHCITFHSVGMLMPGGQSIFYNAASRDSRMIGNKLTPQEGVSFSVVDHMVYPFFFFPIS
jgi:hypothetical protein